MTRKSFLRGLAELVIYPFLKTHAAVIPALHLDGILVFTNTSEVLQAEKLLKKAGIKVEVKGPPPELQSGCDLVIVFPVMKQVVVEKILSGAALAPSGIFSASDSLLEPVSIFHVKDFDEWLMVRAANMKVTIEKRTGLIVNISGGGCPDVPLLAQKLVGNKLSEAPEPLELGHTLCCYCLQKAFEELKRLCG